MTVFKSHIQVVPQLLVAACAVAIAVLTLVPGCTDQADQARSLMRRATEQQEAGQYAEALQTLNRAAALQPTLADVWFVRGQCSLQLGQPAAAARDLHRATGIRPDWGEAWHELGRAQVATGLKEDAIVTLSEAISLDPANVAALFERSQLLKKLGRESTALADLNDVILLSPHHRDARLLRAELMIDADPQQVIEDMSAVITPGCDDASAWYWRGLAQLRIQEWERAIADLGVSCRLRPSEPRAWLARSHGLEALHRTEDAMQDLQCALRYSHAHPDCTLRLAELFARQGQSQKSIPWLRELLEADGGQVDALQYLARAEVDAGNLAAAEPLYRQMCALAPERTAPRTEYAELLLQLNQPESALIEADALLEVQPDNLRALHVRAAANQHLQRNAAAIEDYTKLASLSDHSAELLLHRARLQVAVGDLKAAESDLSNLLNEFPDCAEAREIRADVREQQGDIEGCLSDLAELRTSEPQRIDLLLRSAALRRTLGQADVAMADLRSALVIDATNPHAVRELVTLLLAEDRRTDALDVLDNGGDLIPSAPDLALLRAVLRFESGRLNASLADCSALLAEKDQMAAAILLHGRILFCRQDYARAVECFDQVERMAPWKVIVVPDSRSVVDELLELPGDHESTVVCGYRCGDQLQLLEYRGRSLAVMGESERALSDLSLLLRIRPDAVEALLARAEIHFRNDDWKAATADCSRALTRDWQNATALRTRSRCHFATSRQQDAVRDLRQLQEQGELTPDDRWVLCQSLVSDGQTTMAVQEATALVTLEPDHTLARRLLASLLEQAGEYSLAVEQLTVLTQQQPEDVELIARLATLLHRISRYEEAIAHYDRAIAIKPDVAEYYLRRGLARQQLGDADSAMQSLGRAIELDDALADAWYVRGNLYASLGERDTAATHYRRVVEIDPRHSAAWYNLGNLLFHQQQFAEAADCWSKAVAIRPDLFRAWNNRGSAYLRLGRYREAIADFEQCLAINPEFAIACDNLAWLLATCEDSSLRNPTGAVALAKRACELTEYRDWNHLSTLAATFAEAGQLSLAATWARKALELAPDEEQDELTRLVELYVRQAERQAAADSGPGHRIRL